MKKYKVFGGGFTPPNTLYFFILSDLLYIYIHRLIGLVGRVFANGPRSRHTRDYKNGT